MRLFLFLFMVNTLAFSQIEVDNGQVIWRSIRQYDGTSEQLLKQLKSSGKFSSLESINNSVIGKFTDAPVSFKGTASMYLMASNMMGSFVVNFKEGRYRITAKNIKFKSQTSVGIFDEGSIYPIEKYALNGNGEFRKRFESKDLPIIETNLAQLFELSQEDDW
ncbi:hypothetical protein [Zobellia nedashkovskayae]|uniref:hypothetical protein n=1 Tax=Zobellia nedashkovskayae TaxID=2779510 RepID=UPI001889E934|nr:hypothetical protein [Zobellia nedashkovskayae]